MSLLTTIIEQARRSPKRIVLSEGEDIRIQQAAIRLVNEQVAQPILLGNIARMQAAFDDQGFDASPITLIDPAESEHLENLSLFLYERRKHKGLTPEEAKTQCRQPLMFANLMLATGLADGTVNGAVHTTADVVRTALQVVGVEAGCKTVSSFFIMLLDQPHHPKQGGILFSDCALVIDPNAEQLAEIALATAANAKRLLQREVKVAMLSFSTSGSAKHERVEKVAQATALAKQIKPDLLIDGEVQFDAALVPAIAAKKVKDSSIHGEADVFIFPSLEAGNIGYKIAERIGGAKAVGPFLQGLSKPANDLSRGCSADDVFNTVAFTALQSG